MLALVTESINRGRDELFARMGAYSGAGHLRVVPQGWRLRRDPRLRLADVRRDLAAARSLPGVAAVTVRAHAQVLLAMGTRVVPLEMVGVDPENEPHTYRFVQKLESGRYLSPGERGAAVVGRAVADRLRADLDDEILATAVGRDGDIEAALFRIVGIAATGSEDLDATICQVSLEDLESLTGLPGAAEVAIVLEDWRETESTRDLLAARTAAGDEVLTWGEIAPDFQGHMEQDKAASRFIGFFIIVIVLLGVASAQLAAVLERRREFAVLSALGMQAGHMVRLVLQEGFTLAFLGGALGYALGAPLVWYLARKGLDFSGYMGSGYSFQGVVLEPVIYTDFGAWMIPYVLLIAFGATLTASLYPAWFAARTDPAVALRVAQ
jgi:putative ABC transport system permease protein